jgi:hypothetical protein
MFAAIENKYLISLKNLLPLIQKDKVSIIMNNKWDKYIFFTRNGMALLFTPCK